MNYDAIDVANYIVNYCIENEKPISNLKLQKLLYYVQAASLVDNSEPAFTDEICAWTYGPVVESVYHKFKVYVNREIDKRVTTRDSLLIIGENLSEAYDPDAIINEEDKEKIVKVIDSYEDYPALKMVNKTHQEAPWKNAYDNSEPYILKPVIEEYYKLHQDRIYG